MHCRGRGDALFVLSDRGGTRRGLPWSPCGEAREGQGKRVEAARNIEEQQEEAQEAHEEDRTLPGGRKGKQRPHVPPHIGQGQQGKEQKDGSPE